MHDRHPIVGFDGMMRLAAQARQAGGPAATEPFITGTP
jgi:hypothetical protein